MRVKIEGSGHELPHEALVPTLVGDLVGVLNNERESLSALERAAFALWRLNWIHPFAGGNGRTARAVTYLVLCIENGATLPGIPTMPALIFRHRTEYVKALRTADAAEKSGRSDISQMAALLEMVLSEQLNSALRKLATSSKA
jgi:Fic family protein